MANKRWFWFLVALGLLGLVSYATVSRGQIYEVLYANLASTISAVHTFNPPTTGPPFTIGARASGQTVVGLKADTVATGASDGQHSLDGTNVTSNDPINFQDTAEIDLTNPSLGNIQIALKTDAVAYAKIQNVSATDRVLGRTTAGAGDIEEIATTGSGSVVRATSPTLVTPALGTPASGVLTNATGLPTAGLNDDAVTYAKMQNVSATDRVLGRSTAGAGDTEEITVGGDITQSGSTFTVGTDAVTYAKMQNVSATDRVLGRSTAGAGDTEEIPFPAAARDMAQDTWADDQIWVADSASAGTARAVTNCTDTGGNHLNYTAATNTFSCGTSGSGDGGDEVQFYLSGTCTTGTKPINMPVPRAFTVLKVTMTANTAPTGATMIGDVLECTGADCSTCASIFVQDGTRPTIAASGKFDDSGTPSDTSIAANSCLQVQIDQCGSTIAGADVVLRVVE